MLTGICAAGTFNTADIVVVVILAIGVLFGIIAGFAKMLNGSLGTIIAIIGSVVCAIFLADKLAGVSFLANLTSTLENKIGGQFSVCDLPAKVSGGTIFVQQTSGGDWVALTECVSSTKAKLVTVAQPVLVKLCGSTLNGTASIAYATGFLVSKICAGAIIVVGGIIVLEIIFSLLSKLFTKLIAKQKPLRTIDRLIGLIFSSAIVVLIVFAAMLVVAKLGDKASAVTDMINAGTVAKWFYENNPFLALM